MDGIIYLELEYFIAFFISLFVGLLHILLVVQLGRKITINNPTKIRNIVTKIADNFFKFIKLFKFIKIHPGFPTKGVTAVLTKSTQSPFAIFSRSVR